MTWFGAVFVAGHCCELLSYSRLDEKEFTSVTSKASPWPLLA